MASNSIQSKAVAMIDEIYSLSKSSRCSSMIAKITNFTAFIDSHVGILHSNINRYFYKIGLVPILLNCCLQTRSEFAKEILRLVHMFLKTNNHLKKDLISCEKIVQYLSKILDDSSTWENLTLFKYHMHIYAYIMVSVDWEDVLDFQNIHRMVGKNLNENTSSEFTMLLIVLYASIPRKEYLKSISLHKDDVDIGKIISTSVLRRFIDILTGYLCEFQSFYNNPENEMIQYSYYLTPAEFTFDQICHTIIYYACRNEQFYMDILDKNIFLLISNIFLVKYVPHEYVMIALDVLKVPSLYPNAKEMFKQRNHKVIDYLNHFLINDSITEAIMGTILGLIKQYWAIESHSMNDGDYGSEAFLSSQSDSYNTNSSQMFYYDSFVLNDWLTENNIGYLNKFFVRLSGKGLHQLKMILNENNGRCKLLSILTSTMRLDVVSGLELLGCLESLNIQ